MTAFTPGLIVGYILGVASMCGLVGLYLLHRPRYTAPTRRRNRDRLPEVHNYPSMPVCKPVRQPCIGCYGGDLPCVCGNRQTARDAEVGISYQWLGVTGSEQE
jgi:hypothetical protein